MRFVTTLGVSIRLKEVFKSLHIVSRNLNSKIRICFHFHDNAYKKNFTFNTELKSVRGYERKGLVEFLAFLKLQRVVRAARMPITPSSPGPVYIYFHLPIAETFSHLAFTH